MTARKPRLFGCNPLSLKGLDPLGKAGQGLNLPPPPACTVRGSLIEPPSEDSLAALLRLADIIRAA